ncbi:DUF4760 domain-containing protein [Acinetobacter baumannii]|nr:DUF4760 domain-containing protein [Acinetobacter baumannii]MDC5102008.1 DUF4760 domain-containing protein [Acinetobacter baumannii]
MSYFHTYLLIVPYIALTFYFITFQSDKFFLKTRSSVQFLFVLLFLGFVFGNLLVWKALFIDYDFLGYSVKSTATNNKSTGLITILATVAAVCGWIFTARVQTINAIKGHSMQVLMNSRTSTVYMQKVDKTIEIRRSLLKGDGSSESDKQDVVLTAEKFEALPHEDDRSAVVYMLNFLEFVAIGIRHYNLDEELIRSSLRSILNSNYKLYKPVIEHLRKADNPAIFVQLELLHDRWADSANIYCSKCKTWHPNKPIFKHWKDKHKTLIHIAAAILTCGFWLLLLGLMWAIGRIAPSPKKDKKICDKCKAP